MDISLNYKLSTVLWPVFHLYSVLFLTPYIVKIADTQFILRKTNLIDSLQKSDDSVFHSATTDQNQDVLSPMASSVHKSVIPFDEGM